MGKSVHVVLLAGGYSREVARDAAAAIADADAVAAAGPAPPPGGKAPGGAGAALTAVAAASSSSSSSPAVAPALLPLNGTPAVVRLLRALKPVQRVNLAAVWVVHNEGDSAALSGPGGLFGAAPATELGLPAVNFVSNGATGPQDWRGETADLGSALAAIGSGSGSGTDASVAVISAWLAFVPNYNMQRLLEHSHLRGRDVVGSSFLNGVDLELLGGQGHVAVVPGDDSTLPKIERLERLGSASEGCKVAEPYLFLRPETVAAVVAGGAASRASGLVDLAQSLVAGGTYVAAIDLMFGRYHLRTARAVDYADRFFAFCAAAAIDPAAVGLKHDAVLQPYGTAPAGTKIPGAPLPPPPAAGSFLGRSTAADFRFDELDKPPTTGLPAGAATGRPTAGSSDSLYGTDYEAFLRAASAFNVRFFGDESAGHRPAPGMKHYLLPPTFYMTAYRRLGADIMF